MKLIICFSILSLFLFSCKDTFYSNSTTYIPIVFDTIPSVPKGDFSATATLKFKQNALVDKDQVKAYKQLALVPKVNYGAWGVTGGNASSGAQLIGVNNLNGAGTWKERRNLKRAKRGNIRSTARLASDPTYDRALYELIEAHPEIDYWTNIRVSRKVQGRNSWVLKRKKQLAQRFPNGWLGSYANASTYIKTGEETVTVTATGVDMLTDEELKKQNNKKN
jgi:hypothetical protein